MKLAHTIISALVVGLTGACAVTATAQAPVPLAIEKPKVEVEVVTTKDVTYKTVEGITEEAKALLKLDIYAPKDAKNLPVLVWFHGGGLTGGDKASRLTAALCKALSTEGFVVASANHRLNPQVKYPTYLEDGAAAVAWMKQNAATYGGNPNQLFIGGHSAGGYLSAQIGTDARYLKSNNVELSQISGLIPVSGQMTTHYTIRTERGLPETTIVIDEAAPLYHARKDTPPMLILYGEKDMALRAEENQYFAAALKVAGNEWVTCLQMAGRDHGGIIAKMAESDDPVRREIVKFMKSTVEKKANEQN